MRKPPKALSHPSVLLASALALSSSRALKSTPSEAHQTVWDADVQAKTGSEAGNRGASHVLSFWSKPNFSGTLHSAGIAAEDPVDLPFPAKSARNNTRDEYYILHKYGSGADIGGSEHIARLAPGETWSSEDGTRVGMYELHPVDPVD